MFVVLKLLLDPKFNSQLMTNACHPQVKFGFFLIIKFFSKYVCNKAERPG